METRRGAFQLGHVNGVVVGRLLLGGMVANGSAVVRVAAWREFQRAEHWDMVPYGPAESGGCLDSLLRASSARFPASLRVRFPYLAGQF